YSAVVTSKVLNEGVDVPDANVAIVVSGSGSVREHVQRLRRVLRKKDRKTAGLYQPVTPGTSETFTRGRRGKHRGYRRSRARAAQRKRARSRCDEAGGQGARDGDRRAAPGLRRSPRRVVAGRARGGARRRRSQREGTTHQGRPRASHRPGFDLQPGDRAV